MRQGRGDSLNRNRVLMQAAGQSLLNVGTIRNYDPIQSLASAGVDMQQQKQIRENAISARYVSNRGALPAQEGIYGRIENTGLMRDIYKSSPINRKMNEYKKNWVKNATSVLKLGQSEDYEHSPKRQPTHGAN